MKNIIKILILTYCLLAGIGPVFSQEELNEVPSIGEKLKFVRLLTDTQQYSEAMLKLQEIEKVVQLLKKIDINTNSDYARLGSLVYTDSFTYFIGISIGAVAIGKSNYLCVALNSPVGMLLSGKKKGDEFTLNEKRFKITSIK